MQVLLNSGAVRCVLALFLCSLLGLSAAMPRSQISSCVIEYYFQPGCARCNAITPIIASLEAQFPRIRVIKLSLDEPHVVQQLEQAYIARGEEPKDVPVVFVGNATVWGRSLTDLKDIVARTVNVSCLSSLAPPVTAQGMERTERDFPPIDFAEKEGTILTEDETIVQVDGRYRYIKAPFLHVVLALIAGLGVGLHPFNVSVLMGLLRGYGKQHTALDIQLLPGVNLPEPGFKPFWRSCVVFTFFMGLIRSLIAAFLASLLLSSLVPTHGKLLGLCSILLSLPSLFGLGIKDSSSLSSESHTELQRKLSSRIRRSLVLAMRSKLTAALPMGPFSGTLSLAFLFAPFCAAVNVLLIGSSPYMSPFVRLPFMLAYLVGDMFPLALLARKVLQGDMASVSKDDQHMVNWAMISWGSSASAALFTTLNYLF